MESTSYRPAEMGGDGGEPQVSFQWTLLPRGKTRVQAILGGDLIHCHEFKLGDMGQRTRFLKGVARGVRARTQAEISPEQLEAPMLALVEEAEGHHAVAGSRQTARYRAIDDPEEPEHTGMYLDGPGGLVLLANAIVTIDRDVTIEDAHLRRRRFEGRVRLNGIESSFSIPAEDFGNGSKIISAIFAAAGPSVVIHCRGEVLGRAISANSNPATRTISTDFGWDAAGTSYRSPSVRIDADGIHPVGEDDPIRIDLGDEQGARRLDLAMPGPGELAGLKRHIVDDFLRLHDRRVMLTLLAAAALAVLYRFVEGRNRPVIWLVGLTGNGKSYAAKLAQNFFGDFPIALGEVFETWSSTVGSIQRQGHFYRDATYLVDDFKPDLTKHYEVLKLLQNYADGSARGRLNPDSTSKVTRPIRGVLVSTGEATPEQASSGLARTVVVHVPSDRRDVERGARCLEHRLRYPAFMAGFIHHLMAGDGRARFAARVGELERHFIGPIVGAQNDQRIAGNLALLGAALEEIAGYLGNDIPEVAETARRYVEGDLPTIRDEMIATVREQQPSEVFLTTLAALIQHGRVQITTRFSARMMDQGGGHTPVIGTVVRRAPDEPEMYDISTSLALEAVQDSLRRQGKPPLAISERSLIGQLAGDGKLVSPGAGPGYVGSEGKNTRDVRIGGTTKKAFRILASELNGIDGWPEGPGVDGSTAQGASAERDHEPTNPESAKAARTGTSRRPAKRKAK